MTKDEIKTKINDLFPRIPYGVKGLVRGKKVEGILVILLNNEYPCVRVTSGMLYQLTNNDFVPLLRPLEDMTGEEREYIRNRWNYEWDGEDVYNLVNNYKINVCDAEYFIDWLNSRHFDYRCLIAKGLAKKAEPGTYFDNLEEK